MLEREEHVALCSVVNDKFVAGFICMERSLREQNPSWHYPAIVLYEDELCPLSEASKRAIDEHCDSVVFEKVNRRRYDKVFKYAAKALKTPERLLPAFYILEALGLSQFERVICLDSDLLICGDLTPLLLTEGRFSAVRALDGKTNEPRDFVNTGVMVIREAYLRGFALHESLERIAQTPVRPGTGKADQAVLNLLFGNHSISYLPARFNYTKRSLANELGLNCEPEEYQNYLVDNGINVLHFVGEKPWCAKVRKSEKAYAGIESLWFEALRKYAKPSLLFLLDQQSREWADRYATAVETNARAPMKKGKPNKGKKEKSLEARIARDMGL